ncbi:MAG TPA: CPXCG motif-containing cysteine-rich protein [Gammaproteobacteria bacterium]|nr:CPXCG motif-containing cysteine-rich protein [Gammaproteobacteria bacterium]HET7587560.1 CPXCG motif-containing cysteine-rich protein [Gammaproteobacteria bacterium]
MNPLEEKDVTCPYCGETFGVVLDLTAGDQRYIQDCEVCCQPIELDVQVDLEGETATVGAQRTDE